MKNLTIALVQMRSVLGDAQANAERMCRWIRQAAVQQAQLIVFPECSLTGFATQPPDGVALAVDDASAVLVEQVARECEIAVGYGFVERAASGRRPYNTYIVADASSCLEYRKTHLGQSEQASYAVGDKLPVAQVAGVCVGVQLCWEAHVPEIAATLRAKGAELLLAPHASPLGGERRLTTWNRYLPARALDNGLFVVACNALQTKSPESTDATRMGGGMVAYAADGGTINSYAGADEHMMLVEVGGALPRDGHASGMRAISYFDRRRPELYE